MFGKIMRIPDELMVNYFQLLTDVPRDDIDRLTNLKRSNPRDAKETLAKTVIAIYHSEEAAETAAEEFRRVHSGGGSGLPDDVPDVGLSADLMVDGWIVPVDLVIHCGFADSRGAARRLIAENGVRLNGTPIGDALEPIPVTTGDVLQRGRRRFVRLRVSH
jgi:tyrosyl-tRNA synthetase